MSLHSYLPVSLQISQNFHPHYFYHGTNTQEFAFRQQKDGYYRQHLQQKKKQEKQDGQDGQDLRGYITSIETEIYLALLTGMNSCRKGSKEAKDKKPLLLAIPAEKYWNTIKVSFLSTGKNPSARQEIHGKIALEDLVIVDSVEKLEEVCPLVTEKERKKFKKYYL